SATAVGSQLRISAQLVATDSAGAAGEEIVVEGPSAALFGLVDSITTRLIASRSRTPAERLVRIASRSTHSLPALKHYLVGASTLRRSQFDSAVAAFTNAAEIDTTFALAYYGLSLAAEHATLADLSRSSAEKAARFAARLSPHDQKLVNAMVASRRGDAVAAERYYNEIIADFPEDVEAWFQLGEVRFHYGPPRGQPIAMAVTPFRQVLRYEPQNVGVLLHLARIAAGEKDLKGMDSLVRRVESLAPSGNRTLDMRALRAFGHNDTSSIRGILSEVTSAPDLYVPFIAWQVSAYLHDLNGAERVLRVGTHADRPVEWRALAYSILAHIEAGRGRWNSSRAALDSLAVLDPLKALEHRALLSLEPFLKRPDTELRALRDQLERTSPPAPSGAPSRSSLLTVDDQLHAFIRTYLLGSLHARLGDLNGARRLATELEAIKGNPDIQGIARDFAKSVRAAAEPNPSAALRQLEGMRLQTWYEFAMYSPFYSLANERFTRAELADKLNREDEALRWFSSFSDFSFFDVRYEAPAHLKRARILARQKKNALAASHYRAFLAMWQDADSQFQPEIIKARTELAGLSPATSSR
ncbi:MAG TPA: tetratricopeptide repeat protein, partial [Steroidobacteraceae bacterium]|nr:tetratricopeptide repeat protein [Steroidobacteraceae bacterium]